MEPASEASASVAFGRFRVLPHRRELLVDGRPIKLGGRAFDVLMALIEARRAVVSKGALMTRVAGTSLIAAEMTGRICCGLEISPAYVDVIVRRWQAFTGRRAIHQASGQSFDERCQDANASGSADG